MMFAFWFPCTCPSKITVFVSSAVIMREQAENTEATNHGQAPNEGPYAFRNPQNRNYGTGNNFARRISRYVWSPMAIEAMA
jgi:hypothetical protein